MQRLRSRQRSAGKLHGRWFGRVGLLGLALALPALARCAAQDVMSAATSEFGPTGAPYPGAVAGDGENVCAPATFSCPPWRWLGYHRHGAGRFCRPPAPEPVYPRFHPVPTRPVFAPPGIMPRVLDEESRAGGHHGPLATPEGRPLEIEVLPPAPVPDEIVRPQPQPQPPPDDRMTGGPRGPAGRPAEASWIFPMPTESGAGRVASYPDHPGPSVGLLR